MDGRHTTVTMIMTDDDEEDHILVHRALAESQLPINLHIASNGKDLLDYPHNRGSYNGTTHAPRPGRANFTTFKYA
ncbi:response regulator [Umezakia ovalisporum]|uniref:hypothetical protein n=1 Tax=Umezakia ovalisporum TaxID=75695 RepID=UPI0026AD4C96|nr:hypothetical protein [Umezakia ovalisporum]